MWRTSALAVLVVAACAGRQQPAPAAPDPRIASLEKELADTRSLLEQEQKTAAALRASDAELKAKADEAKALQDKLAEVVGKAGEVTTADGAVRLELVDQILFATGEADLTDSGREVLAKVGAALKEVDKQVWVQGHTDDQPYVNVKRPEPKPPAKPEPPKKGAKADPKKPAAKADPKKPAPPDGPEPVIVINTNWELAAARALTVVHYLQDEAKLDPTRLAAVAFSQYRPVSKNRAKNRRIEIVLYPRVALTPK